MNPTRCTTHAVDGHINLVEQMVVADPTKKFVGWTPMGDASWAMVNFEQHSEMGYLSVESFHLYDE
jgi:hypothetical protein